MEGSENKGNAVRVLGSGGIWKWVAGMAWAPQMTDDCSNSKIK